MSSSDVGGGSIANGTRHSLARIPLRWMLRQCFILRTGIHKSMFKGVDMDPDTLYPHVLHRPPHVPYSPDCLAYKYDLPLNFAKNYKETVKIKEPFINEEEEDLLDSLTPMYDQLKMAKGWWLLELLPYKQQYQKPDNTWTHVRGYVDLSGKLVLVNDCCFLSQHQFRCSPHHTQTTSTWCEGPQDGQNSHGYFRLVQRQEVYTGRKVGH